MWLIDKSQLTPVVLVLMLGWFANATAQTNLSATNQSPVLTSGFATNAAALHAETERIRADCIRNRKFVCGRVMQIIPGGLVVDSGYSALLKPPFDQSWVAPANISIERDTNVVESAMPDSLCIGLVFITDIPKRPAVKRYDYITLHGYPCGQYDYVPVGNVHKSIRRFAAGLERAVTLNLKAFEKKAP